ncbi:MAG: hypothetical protein WKF36_09220 [Candidatus Nitrosocosmicus sp.]
MPASVHQGTLQVVMMDFQAGNINLLVWGIKMQRIYLFAEELSI